MLHSGSGLQMQGTALASRAAGVAIREADCRAAPATETGEDGGTLSAWQHRPE